MNRCRKRRPHGGSGDIQQLDVREGQNVDAARHGWRDLRGPWRDRQSLPAHIVPAECDSTPKWRNRQMPLFEVRSTDQAPEGSKAPLRKLEQVFGMVPNVAGVIGNLPVLANIFVPCSKACTTGR